MNKIITNVKGAKNQGDHGGLLRQSNPLNSQMGKLRAREEERLPEAPQNVKEIIETRIGWGAGSADQGLGGRVCRQMAGQYLG